MPNRPPWVDLPPKNHTRTALLGNKVKHSSGTPAAGAVQAIVRYHAIRKDAASLFGARITSLREVREACQAVAPRLKGDQAGNAMTLAAMAANKAMYLTRLQTFLQTDTSGINDPYGFMEILERVRLDVPPPPPSTVGWARAQVGGGQMGLHGGVALEKLDPFHRENEMHFDSRTGARLDMWSQANVHAGGTGRFAVPYARKVLEEGYSEPFLAFLEICDCCTWVGQDAASVTAVQYADDGGLLEGTSLVSLSDGRLWETTSAGQLQLFDTTSITGGKGGTHKTKAYVWLASGDFVVGEHSGGSMHHSSLVGGGIVRCAGMIGATRGRVHYIDTNSGHYRPNMAQLYNLLKFLDAQLLIAGDAVTHAGGATMSIAQYLLTPVRNFGGSNITIGKGR